MYSYWSKMPLLTLKELLKVYKYSFVKNPKFGMDIYRDDFECQDIVILEKDVTLKKNVPIKFDFYALLLCIEGQLIRNINQYEYLISEHTLQLLPPNTIYSFENITETTQIYILFFTEPFIKANKPEHVSQSIHDIFDFHNNNFHPAKLSQSLFARVLHLYKEINTELHEKQEGYPTISRLIIFKLLIILMRKKKEQNDLKNTFKTRAEQLLHDYIGLVEKHFLEFRKISDYAKLLNITSKHLGETIKETLGQNALTPIHRRLLKEALYLLEYTDLSISQIGTILAFDNPSEFTRFFKAHYKITPKAFRLNINY